MEQHIFPDGLKNVRPINKGLSGDEKLYAETESGRHVLLRISSIDNYEQKQSEFEIMRKMETLGVPMPSALEFGELSGGKRIFTLLEWVDGIDAEHYLPRVSPAEQYNMGLEAGRILKIIHGLDLKKSDDDWAERYLSVIEPRLEAFKKEDVGFSGDGKIHDFLEENKGLLKSRPQCCQHGDYHIGNMIASPEGLKIIDWHTVDFNNYGDPWYDFNRIGKEYPAFASGQVDGYFKGKVPEEFWRLFAFYLSASAITSIVWAKYFAPKCMGDIMRLNEKVLMWFDGMERVVPSWYGVGK